MIITAPITDYIPASILTVEGQVIRRGAADPEAVPLPPNMSALMGYPGAISGEWRAIGGVLNTYWKAQGTNVWPVREALALSDTGVHIGNDSRNAAGDQVITGVGFLPSVVIILACDSTGANKNWSVGLDVDGVRMCLYNYDNDTSINTSVTYSAIVQRAAGNRLQGYISARGADGFTITWTIAGATILEFVYLCLP